MNGATMAEQNTKKTGASVDNIVAHGSLSLHAQLGAAQTMPQRLRKYHSAQTSVVKSTKQPRAVEFHRTAS
jgi:hypothetical protein